MSTNQIHPEYFKALAAKHTYPAELYAYPTAARRKAARNWHRPQVPTPPTSTPVRTQWMRSLVIGYVAVGLLLWFAAATLPPTI